MWLKKPENMCVVRVVSRKRGKNRSERLDGSWDMIGGEGGMSWFSQIVVVEKLDSIKIEPKTTEKDH